MNDTKGNQVKIPELKIIDRLINGRFKLPEVVKPCYI